MAKKNPNRTNRKKANGLTKMDFSSRKLHKDWRVWAVVLFMLAAILMYVLTLDESIIPASFTK